MAAGHDPIDPRTAETAATVALQGLQRQLDTGDQIDAKAWQTLAVSTVVLGIAAAALDGPRITVVAAGYLLVALLTLATVRPRGWKVPPTPVDVWAGYWNRPVAELHHALVDSAGRAYPVNRLLLRGKRRLLLATFVAFALDTLLLAALAAW